jgi:hypothetical protein
MRVIIDKLPRFEKKNTVETTLENSCLAKNHALKDEIKRCAYELMTAVSDRFRDARGSIKHSHGPRKKLTCHLSSAESNTAMVLDGL